MHPMHNFLTWFSICFCLQVVNAPDSKRYPYLHEMQLTSVGGQKSIVTPRLYRNAVNYRASFAGVIFSKHARAKVGGMFFSRFSRWFGQRKSRFEIDNPTRFCYFGSLTRISIFAKFEIPSISILRKFCRFRKILVATKNKNPFEKINFIAKMLISSFQT